MPRGTEGIDWKVMDDDVEIKQILLGAGVLNVLDEAASSAAYSKYNQVSTVFEWDGWWCAGTRHWGQEIETENGYTLIMLSNKTYTKEQAVEKLGGFLIDSSHGENKIETVKKDKYKQN